MPIPSNLTQTLSLTLPSPLQRFSPPWPGADKLTMWIKRDDSIHPVISGNKWRKLQQALTTLPQGTQRIISFGGGYSNHLHALGYVCHKFKIPFTAIIRGDYCTRLTPMLGDLQSWDCDLQFINKATYKLRDDPDYLAQWHQRFPHSVIIPEGGSQVQALAGMQDMVAEIDTDFTQILLPVGSGGSLAGVASALSSHQHATGIAVLRGQDYLEERVNSLLPAPRNNWHIEHRFHHGGYAKAPQGLLDFCHTLFGQTGLAVEPVYSGKLFYAVAELIAEGAFAAGEKLVLVHTGGLQGARKG